MSPEQQKEMSLERLTFAEGWHYLHDLKYRQAVRAELKRLGLRLRLPIDFFNDDSGNHIDLYMAVMGRATGHAPTRVRKRVKWEDIRKDDLTYEEMYTRKAYV